jgi:23S rRNA pseudouridine2605 synthase
MNNKKAQKKGARPTSSRPSSNKPKPAMQKRHKKKSKNKHESCRSSFDKVENPTSNLRDVKDGPFE